MQHGVSSNGEKIPTQVYGHADQASVAVAGEIAELIRSCAAAGRNCVLGLATGSTPTGVYAELVRRHKTEGLSFANVITFNLDEYFPMKPNELQSYRRFMQEHLFDHIDIKPQNVNVPDGTIPIETVNDYCKAYEKKIQAVGGLDMQLLGIGRTGHIGFNEPGSGSESRTRLITLDKVTRLDAASDFFGEEYVPRRAITMGVGTILEARRIVMMAFGEGKARIVAQAVEGPVTPVVAASFLQQHKNAQVMLDDAAAAHLTRYKSPWLVGSIEWDKATIRKAVIWLAQTVKKPLLKLTDEDYNESGLQDLLAAHGPAYLINLDIFRAMQETITGWPGGKPDEMKRPGDIRRPADSIFPKRVLLFSPHPDDDVISMGGTLIRLVEQKHEVHVAYQTSGNIAVFDSDAIRFADFAAEFSQLFGIGAEAAQRLEQQTEEFVKNKKPGQLDSPVLQQIKGLIRRGEARAAGRECGLPVERMHFMDLPFYETGTVRKKPLGEEDIRLTAELLEKIKPHQIYAAGDLSDPHGTHRVCLTAIFQAIERIKSKPWFKDTEVWLYRGAWQEWEPERVEMAVPLSPLELLQKRNAIFKHQSQKDRAMFPGSDEREFWQRAEARNRQTAKVYDELGLAEYEAIEGFVQWHPPVGAADRQTKDGIAIMTTVADGRFEKAFLTAGMASQQAKVKAGLFMKAIERIERQGATFNEESAAFFVPGRIEFLGKHTDYAGGRSLLCAIDRGFCIVATPRSDSKIRVSSAAGEAAFDLSPQLTPQIGQWTNYPMTAARRIARNFTGALRGADIAFESDLPPSSGLSSSSALIITFFLALRAINKLDKRQEYKSAIKTPEDLSGYLGTIENGQNFGPLVGDRGVGTFGGSEDHTAIMWAKPHRLVQYSFCPVRLKRTVPLPADHVLAIGVSGVEAEKTGEARELYNAASLLVSSIMDYWRQSGGANQTLAQVVADEDSREKLRKILKTKPDAPTSAALIDRLEQFIAESTEIIPMASDALAAGRLNELGPIIDRSQELTERLLKNQIDETIFLARSARECGATAASAFGAGFGGSVWALVPAEAIERFLKEWRTKYAVRFANAATRAQFFEAAAGAGAMPV